MGFDITGIGSIADVIDDILKMFPNPQQKADAQLKIQELIKQVAQAQADINKTEAGSPSLFIAGWRPFIGWTGGFCLLYSFILQPLFHLPPVDTSKVITVLVGMLGLG